MIADKIPKTPRQPTTRATNRLLESFPLRVAISSMLLAINAAMNAVNGPMEGCTLANVLEAAGDTFITRRIEKHTMMGKRINERKVSFLSYSRLMQTSPTSAL